MDMKELKEFLESGLNANQFAKEKEMSYNVLRRLIDNQIRRLSSLSFVETPHSTLVIDIRRESEKWLDAIRQYETKVSEVDGLLFESKKVGELTVSELRKLIIDILGGYERTSAQNN